MKRVLTLGTFDLFHAGHAKFLKEAAQLGNLFVGVNSDKHVRQFKRDPIIPETERLEIVWGNRHVTRAFQYDGKFKKCIEEWSPDILVIGSDWADAGGARYLKHLGVTQEWLSYIGVTLIFLNTPVTSTTEIIERVRSRG